MALAEPSVLALPSTEGGKKHVQALFTGVGLEACDESDDKNYVLLVQIGLNTFC